MAHASFSGTCVQPSIRECRQVWHSIALALRCTTACAVRTGAHLAAAAPRRTARCCEAGRREGAHSGGRRTCSRLTVPTLGSVEEKEQGSTSTSAPFRKRTRGSSLPWNLSARVHTSGRVRVGVNVRVFACVVWCGGGVVSGVVALTC